MSMKLTAQVNAILKRLEDIDGQIDRLYQLSTAYKETANEIKLQVQDIRNNSMPPKVPGASKKGITKSRQAKQKRLPNNSSS